MTSLRRLVTIFRAGSVLCLGGMVLLTCADVIGGTFGYPVLGSEELVGLMGSLLLAFALPFAHAEKSHVRVELFYDRFPPRVKRLLDVVTGMACATFFAAAAWQSYRYAAEMKRVGLVSPTVEFPVYYTIYGVAASCLILTVVMVAETAIRFRESDHG